MKKMIMINSITFIVFVLNACSSHNNSPSQNNALNKITSSPNKEGIIQKKLNRWLKDEWTPTIEKDKKIVTKYGSTKDNTMLKKNFTLQEYVDKAVVYINNTPDTNNSHTKMVESLPVIGK